MSTIDLTTSNIYVKIKGRHIICQKNKQKKTIKNSIKKSDSLFDLILKHAITKEVSDIHLSEGEKLVFRIHGKIEYQDKIIELLEKSDIEEIIYQLIGDEKILDKLVNTRELDLAYLHEDSGTNFRVNVFFKRKNIAIVMRRIEEKSKPCHELGIPEGVIDMLNKKQGLLLVTGPTGSGKSTSMQAMLEHINNTEVFHIITIEDPIEYIFKNNQSFFSQREIGSDTLSFSSALKSALREDPDIVMIGELRDHETMTAAMHLAETGHLVISTLHTSSAAQTISRIVSSFPSGEQSQIQSRLADSMIGVLSQRLVPKADGDGRIGIFEVMKVNTGIRNLIRTGDIKQIPNAILTGKQEGMILMKDYADELKDEGIINLESYEGYFRNE